VLYKSVMYIKCTQEDSIHISERFAFIRRPTKEEMAMPIEMPF